MDFVAGTWAAWPEWLRHTLTTLAQILAVTIVVILCVAYLTLAERKVIGYMQVRIGPNRVGPKGLLQPFADVIKLLIKEVVVPARSNRFLFVVAPLLALTPAFAAWAVISLWPGFAIADVDAGVLYVLALAGFGAYGIILAGWATNSKYAFLGRDALRGADRGLRDRDGLRAGGRGDGRRHAQHRQDRRGAVGRAAVVVLAVAVPAVPRVLHLGRGGDQPCPVRRGRGRVGDRRRASTSSTPASRSRCSSSPSTRT